MPAVAWVDVDDDLVVAHTEHVRLRGGGPPLLYLRQSLVARFGQPWAPGCFLPCAAGITRHPATA